MITTSSTEATIHYFLNFVKSRNPEIAPAIVMSDRDQGQLNAIKAVYSESRILLCWWHVLRAMRSHFRTEEFPKLWERVHEWVKTPDPSKFDSWWDEMQADPAVPLSFIDYLKVQWMPIVPLWAGSARKYRSIFQEGDTNMLIEA